MAQAPQASPSILTDPRRELLELVITGPDSVPVPRKNGRPRFTATLINHSNETLVFVPPRSDWYGERRLEWHAVDSKGQWLDRQPNYVIECDPPGTMRAVPDVPAPLLIIGTPKQIRDSDLIVLGPGQKHALKNLADPWFALNLHRHDQYRLSLHFSSASDHYQLPKGSRYSAALNNSSGVEADSNELNLTIN
jgi:hypothetical protein